jgi:histone acetyltransferase
MMRPVGKNATKARIEELLALLVAEPRGWAFLEPVSPSDVADYYEVIKEPMGGYTPQWICTFTLTLH